MHKFIFMHKIISKLNFVVYTCIMFWLEQFLNEFLLVFEAAQAGDGLEYVVVDELELLNHVSLHDLHHRVLQFHLTLASCYHPGMSVHLFQLKSSTKPVSLYDV